MNLVEKLYPNQQTHRKYLQGHMPLTQKYLCNHHLQEGQISFKTLQYLPGVLH